MDLCIRLNTVATLNDYIELTQELENEPNNVEIVVNMSTILCLKKICCLEIEYFNKCDGSGAAFKLFEMMLASPPLKTWSLLAPELIGLIQYWLDAVRNLISHHLHWWMFLKKTLDFIKKICEKDQLFCNTLVEQTAKCLLDLATNGKPDVNQRYEILYTFNICCASSSREIRMTMRPALEHYFVRLAAILSTCGHAPCQLAALEALLRWLQPRGSRAARSAAASSWLHPHLYCRPAVQLFLQRDWLGFYQDARDFINLNNETKEQVVSILCKRLTVGDIAVYNEEQDRNPVYVDVNAGGASVTATLEPALLRAHFSTRSCEALTVREHAAERVTVDRINNESVLLISMLEPPTIEPSGYRMGQAGNCDITAVVESNDCLTRWAVALKNLFGEKFQESEYSKIIKVDVLHSGVVRRSRRRVLRSPSTTSTTSLAQLHDKLESLSYYEFTREPVRVVAQRELSVVNESTESEISHSLENANQNFQEYFNERKSQSDGEAITLHSETNRRANVNNNKETQSDNECAIKTNAGISSLFAVTIQSADENTLNETIQLFPKDKDLNTHNLMELLVQEALQAKPEQNDKLADSGVNSGDAKKTPEKTQSSEVIEDTQYTGLRTVAAKTHNIVRKSTSDESNTETVNEAPSYVNVRKRNQRKRPMKKTESQHSAQTYDDTVENFFNQHNSENQMGEITISPTLAKKINETSSESSTYILDDIENDLEFDIQNENIPDMEIVECLNNIVDQVCIDFEKCTEIFEKDSTATEILNVANDVETVPLQDVSNKTEAVKDRKNSKTLKARGKAKPVIKLKFGTSKKAPKKSKGKLKLEPASKMSTIIEANTESDANKTSTGSKKDSTDNDADAPLVRRKRKLYSPKDDQINFDKATQDTNPFSNPVTPRSNKNVRGNKSDQAEVGNNMITPKSGATCYKDIEKDREKFKSSRAKRSKNKEIFSSPKTRAQDDMFENLKNNIESNERIILVDKKSDKDVAIYNFTSDSEDEDFKQKKVEIQKRTSTTTVGSGNSVISTRRGRPVSKINYTEDGRSSSNETSKKPPPKRKRATKRKNTKQVNKNNHEINIEQLLLVDERMREAPPENLNTSFVAVNVDKVVHVPVPEIQAPQLEEIPAENPEPAVQEKKKKVTAKKKESKHNIPPLEFIKDDDRTISPLPGLVIEPEKGRTDGEESVTTNLVQKLKNIYKQGPETYNDTNTTQNMLLDNDSPNSPQMNITEEFSRMLDNNKNQNLSEQNKKSSDTDANTIDDTINSSKIFKDASGKSSKSQRNKLRLKERKTPAKEIDKTNDTKQKRIKKPATSKVDDVKSSQRSRVIESSIEEVIVEPDFFVTKTLTQSKAKSIELEMIEIASPVVSEAKSERSIATDGITGHGDTDESPPRTDLLTEQMMPRELHDMEQTIKEYYLQLHSKVNASKDSVETPAHDFRKRESTPSTSFKNKKSPVKKGLFKEQDYDISKCLPSCRETEPGKSFPSSTKSPVVSLKKLTLEDLAKWLPSTKTTPDTSYEKSRDDRVLRRSPRLNNNRKSQISPIDVEDFFPRQALDSSRSKDVTFNSQDAEYAQNIRLQFPRPTHQSSPISESSKSSSVVVTKRKHPREKVVEVKKMRLDTELEAADASGSRRCSDVVEWLKSNRSSSKVSALNIDASNEVLQNVMEKLDTTLAEIHQNTTKDFISLFVEAQKTLEELKSERRTLYKKTAIDMLTNVIQLIDHQFAMMDERAEQRENAFMSWLKERASDVLKRDCRQKRVMVTLLKEDAQSVANHLSGVPLTSRHDSN